MCQSSSRSSLPHPSVTRFWWRQVAKQRLRQLTSSHYDSTISSRFVIADDFWHPKDPICWFKRRAKILSQVHCHAQVSPPFDEDNLRSKDWDISHQATMRAPEAAALSWLMISGIPRTQLLTWEMCHRSSPNSSPHPSCHHLLMKTTCEAEIETTHIKPPWQHQMQPLCPCWWFQASQGPNLLTLEMCNSSWPS